MFRRILAIVVENAGFDKCSGLITLHVVLFISLAVVFLALVLEVIFLICILVAFVGLTVLFYLIVVFVEISGIDFYILLLNIADIEVERVNRHIVKYIDNCALSLI